MSVTITVEQENTVVETTPGEVRYQVSYKVIASEGISLALFTFKVEPDGYSHPSTVYDLDAYPEDRNEAINQGLEFYRAAEVVRQFEDLTDAIQFASVTRSRLTALTSDLPVTQAEFVGQETYTIPVS